MGSNCKCNVGMLIERSPRDLAKRSNEATRMESTDEAAIGGNGLVVLGRVVVMVVALVVGLMRIERSESDKRLVNLKPVAPAVPEPDSKSLFGSEQASSGMVTSKDGGTDDEGRYCGVV